MDPQKAIQWATSFLPGFFALFVFNQIVDSQEIKEFEFLFYLVLLTLMTWLVAWPLFWLINAAWSSSTANSERIDIKAYELHWLGTPVLLLCGFFVGAAMGYFSERNTFYDVVRVLPFARDMNIVSRKPVSIYVFDHNAEFSLRSGVDSRPAGIEDHAWVRVIVEGGAVYHGGPGLYTKGRTFNELFVSPACRVEASRVIKHEGAGVFLESKTPAPSCFITLE
ncbi:MAG: hypothetical protein AAGK93_02850, partial [Pseudomonadota bacterium]